MRQSLVLYSMKLAPSCAIRSKKSATKESGRTNLSLLFFCQAYKKIVAQTSATYFEKSMHVAETCRQISRCRHVTKDEDITWHRSRKRRWPVNCSRCFPVWNCTNLVFIETKDTQRWIKLHTHIFKQSYFNCASKWRNRLIWCYRPLQVHNSVGRKL